MWCICNVSVVCFNAAGRKGESVQFCLVTLATRSPVMFKVRLTVNSRGTDVSAWAQAEASFCARWWAVVWLFSLSFSSHPSLCAEGPGWWWTSGHNIHLPGWELWMCLKMLPSVGMTVVYCEQAAWRLGEGYPLLLSKIAPWGGDLSVSWPYSAKLIICVCSSSLTPADCISPLLFLPSPRPFHYSLFTSLRFIFFLPILPPTFLCLPQLCSRSARADSFDFECSTCGWNLKPLHCQATGPVMEQWRWRISHCSWCS